VNLEISPQPSDEERKAILAALEADEAEQSGPSPWAKAALPQRQAEEPDEA
jgi:hypothetical protein